MAGLDVYVSFSGWVHQWGAQWCSWCFILAQHVPIFLTASGSRMDGPASSPLLAVSHGLNTFWTQAIDLANRSLSRNTLKAYTTGCKTFLRFTPLYPCSCPEDINYVMSFTAYCHSELALSASTIKLYLSGIQHFRSLHTPDSPSIFAAHPLKAMLRGIQKTQGRSQLSQQPITGQIFRDMSDILSPSPFGTGPSLVLKAAIFLSFFGFLRPGEVSQASGHAPILLRGSLTRFTEHYELQLPNNKNRQTGQGFVVKYYQTNSNWCPVEVLDSLGNLFVATPSK